MSKKKTVKRKRHKKRKQIKVSIWMVSIIMAILIVLVLLPHVKDDAPDIKGTELPTGSYLYGIDISHYQDNIQWDSLMIMTDRSRRTILSKTQAKELKPVSFVYIKATEGAGMKDKRFKEHWENAADHEIKRGAYHFFRSSKNGHTQARHFIRTVGALRLKDLPPVLDIETIHAGCSNATLNKRALEWLIEVENHYGRKPIVYSSPSFIEQHLSQEITENYPIWVAHYDVGRPRRENWAFWQFTDEALVYGIDGHVDMNVCPASFFEFLD